MTEPANGIEGLQTVETYEQQLSEFLNIEFPKCPSKNLEDLHRDALNELESESIEVVIPKIIQIYVDSSSEPLSELSKNIMKKLTDLNTNFLLSSDEIAKFIHGIATRKNYGKKCNNQYEDVQKISLWCWELFVNKQPSFVLRERGLIGSVVKTLEKLIVEMKKESKKALAESFSRYNKSIFAYNKYKNDELEKKRKSANDQIVKEMKNVEKRKNIEEQKLRTEEKKRKIEEISKRKEAEKQKIEEKKEEERRKKIEEEKKRKEDEEKRKKEELPSKPINTYFLKSISSSKPLQPEEKPVVNSFLPDSTKSWDEIWSIKFKFSARKTSFIYFTDSFLKPYYLGEIRIRENASSLQKFSNIDYEKDSEEEYEEMNGEDINEINEEDEEESDSESENEEITNFIVKDGYLSADEWVEDEEIQVLSVNLNAEILPMQVFQCKSEEFLKFQAFSMGNEEFPIEIPAVEVKTLVKEQKTPKMQVDASITCEIIQMAVGKNSKEEIVNAAIAKFPLIAKASVHKIIKTNLLRQKEGKIQVYRVKEAIQANN